MTKFFTSESVTEGHPDKVCDQLSDMILNSILKDDPEARVACECAITRNTVLVMGEITTNVELNIDELVRKKLKEIGYKTEFGIDPETCKIQTYIAKQSVDISNGVDNAIESRIIPNAKALVGAGDQGMMIGYACDETDSFLPAPIYYAHKLAERLSATRKENVIEGLGPDGKTQVTVEYNNGEIERIDSIVISVQHTEATELSYLKKSIVDEVIKKTICPPLIDERTKIFINPSGRFVIGGPMADSGLTGRKIIVDTYGGIAGHGGGAFSGKDPTKVDRAGAYMARYIAKNVVASGLTKRCEVELAYAIGMARPISVFINTFTGNKKMEEQIIERIESKLDLTPSGIITTLNLREPLYENIAVFGHFGRNELNLPWEKIDTGLFKNI